MVLMLRKKNIYQRLVQQIFCCYFGALFITFYNLQNNVPLQIYP